MNYKLSEGFAELSQSNGVIENNSVSIVEIAIVESSSTPKPYGEGNKLIEPNGKYNYSLEGDKKIFARAYNKMYAKINVFEYEEGATEFDPSQYYTKTKTDELFVKKDGNKVLSDNNYTNADKEKLGKFQYATENPKANGETTVGVSEKLAREDHVHPKQTDITGNAGTADKLKTARAIKLTGAVTGQADFDGSTEVSISVTLGDLEGSSVKKLTGYTKGANSNAITPTDSLLVALGKLEKGVEEAKAQPASVSYNQKLGRDFKICYCTETEYNSKEKVQDDSVIYMILDEKTGTVILKCYRP